MKVSDLTEVAFFVIMIKGLIGRKLDQTEFFTEQGKRLVVTRINTGPCFVLQLKTIDKDGYDAVQLGFEAYRKNKDPKTKTGIAKKAGLTETPRFLMEIPATKSQVGGQENAVKLGEKIMVDQVFEIGDTVKITGTTKGKGFQGVIKRWGFKGDSRTHGTKHTERAPGSIGSSATPSRVLKGKKMSGRMGGVQQTVGRLKVVAIDPELNILTVAGVVPGPKKGLLKIIK